MPSRILTKSLFALFFLFTSTAHAATLYVTDRILLGVHQDPSEESALIRSIPSGEQVETLQTSGAFTRIRLGDGTQGWVTSSFLKPDRPATLELDEVFPKYQKNLETLRAMEEQLNKAERNVQVLRDELSNAKTTIKEMRKTGSQPGDNSAAINEEMEKQLEAANKTLAELKKANEALQAEIVELKNVNQDEATQNLTRIEGENSNLKARIEAALANLKGETVPTPEELAAIRPHFPLWFWGIILIMIVLGVVGGATWMDIQHRRRHGGFRL